MKLSNETKEAIYTEYNTFKEKMYAGKSLEERQELDQFFTPPEITIPMIEKFDCEDLSGKNILDPTSGSGNLLAACLIAGADADKVYGNDYDGKMVKICRERLKNLCLSLGKEGFKYYQIHQGNALHSFCLNIFDEHYDECYFKTNSGNGILKQEGSIIKRLEDPQSDENAYNVYEKFDSELAAKNINNGLTEERKAISRKPLKADDSDKENLFF